MVSVFEAHPMIKDVCAVCNNEKLSELDQYVLEMVKRYFYKEYGPEQQIDVMYDYNLLSRFLMKTCYNSDRSFKLNSDWFRENRQYILGEENESKYSFSVFGGIAVNTSPLPAFFFDNKQLEVLNGTQLLAQGMLRYSDGIGRKVEVVKNAAVLNISIKHSSYVMRIGAGQFLLILWNKNAEEKDIQIHEKLIEKVFPYSLYKEDNTSIKIRRCTHAFNYHRINLIDSYLGMEIADSTKGFVQSPQLAGKKLGEDEWNKYVKNLREEK
ncbi:hypothetical protein [Sporosarcina sp. P20a]|uniref:hypothetical protein n=1 Tax=Sporosarcina sp. P20a TaxID=2048256 RepID=UPI00117B83C4|nr:hypothetical protein [Sporosarcina sp. P20a]